MTVLLFVDGALAASARKPMLGTLRPATRRYKCAWQRRQIRRPMHEGGPAGRDRKIGRCQPFMRKYMSESRSKLPHTILSAVIGEEISMSAQNLKITAPASTPSDKQTLVPDETILWLDQAGATEVNRVGGKNAGLAEVTAALSAAGIRVPLGFATTAAAYRAYVEANGLAVKIRSRLDRHVHLRRLSGTGAALCRDRACGGGTQQRHRRRSAPSQFCRTTGNVFERARRVGAVARLPPMLRLAVHRSSHRLPREQWLRAPAGRAVDRHSENGASGSSRFRRNLHARYGNRLPWRSGHQRGLGAG